MEDLVFRVKNLRDQAARLEKQQRIINDNVYETRESRNGVNLRQNEESENLNSSNSEGNYAYNNKDAKDTEVWKNIDDIIDGKSFLDNG
ncbi:hypothetical protein AC249_AIPGENE25329 [Exaiptasia diaphana]|nr:hypothetical protein AC249_AIPGENE25329 [Exaiptasia diaphana]